MRKKGREWSEEKARNSIMEGKGREGKGNEGERKGKEV